MCGAKPLMFCTNYHLLPRPTHINAFGLEYKLLDQIASGSRNCNQNHIKVEFQSNINIEMLSVQFCTQNVILKIWSTEQPN